FDAAFCADEDGGGLDLAVKDAEGVGGGERLGDLQREARHLVAAQAAALHHGAGGVAFGGCHGHNVDSIDEGDLVDDADMGVAEGGDDLCVALVGGDAFGGG